MTKLLVVLTIIVIGCGHGGEDSALPAPPSVNTSTDVDAGGLTPQADACTCVGEPGPAGATGATGPAGMPGLRGPPGVDGADGVDGEAGPMGPAGADGAPGATGAQGPAGAQGPVGPASTVPGPAGAPGERGPAGEAGTPGAPGIQGAPGPAGAPGSVDASKLYVVEDGATSSSTSQQVLLVQCDPGDVALSGGCGYSPIGTTAAALRVSTPTSSSALPDGWQCVWLPQSSNTTWYGVSVLCINLP